MKKKLVKKIFEKSQNAEKTERGPLGFFNIHSIAKHQKIEGGTLWGIFFSEKSHNAEKIERGDSLVSPGMVCYAEKEGNLFGSVRWAK